MYVTYQHSRNYNTTLPESKSYSFGSSGLGGVLVYNQSYIKNMYDNMPGIKDTLSSGSHFDW